MAACALGESGGPEPGFAMAEASARTIAGADGAGATVEVPPPRLQPAKRNTAPNARVADVRIDIERGYAGLDGARSRVQRIEHLPITVFDRGAASMTVTGAVEQT